MKVTFKGKPLIPSKYLAAEDLQGKRVPVVIESVHERAKLKTEKGDDDDKPLFRLRDKKKGWVLNTTNLESIAEVYGHAAEEWVGKTVVIYATKVRAFGESWLALRVDEQATQQAAERAKNGQQATAKPKQAEPAHNAETGEVSDDEYLDDAQARARAEMTEEDASPT
jgi:hypothetical protein